MFGSSMTPSLWNSVAEYSNAAYLSSLSSSANPLDSLLTVEKAFAGINYLEDLSKLGSLNELIGSIRAAETSADGKSTGGSLHTGDAHSIFNKFSIFKYSKFINGAVYQPQAHFIGYVTKATTDPNDPTSSLNQADSTNRTGYIASLQSDLNNIGNKEDPNYKALERQIADASDLLRIRQNSAANYHIKNSSALANPTASNIIKWSSTQSMESVTGFQPYAMTDFLFCKNYGKIPNNRLVTLRRYPFPMDDLIRAPGNKNPFPISQAVTWFGEGTDNVLSNIGVMNWGLRWDSTSLRIDDYQTVDGNEVTLDDLMGIFDSDPKFAKLAKGLRAAYVGLYGNDTQLAQLTGMEKKLQEYSKKLYTPDGPYWNRIFGPVNVVNATTRRARGMQDGWNNPFILNFHYSFRSYSGLSPKIVALDLIANFLNLTYNDAQFRGQLLRYFPRLGVKFSPTTTQALGELLTKWGTSFDKGSMVEITKLAQTLMDAIKTAGSDVVKSASEIFTGDLESLSESSRKLFQAGTASLLAGAIPNLISIKSALSDRPIGEWHLVVGNPMNPIMVMGDLVCMNCVMKFDEEMGPDDFPTGCTFSIKLAQGKPRDKAAIERMFNLGEAKLMFNKMKNPSSAFDTWGDENTAEYAKLAKSAKGPSEIDLTDEEKKNLIATLGTGSFESYRNRIRKSYGYNYEGSKNVDDTAIKMDDSLLWLYFDRGQEKA